MKTKILSLLLVGGLLAAAAWLVHVPSHAQQDQDEEVPKKYRETVQKGLEYLAKNQHKDGHWEGDDGKHPVAMTGLVGMALLMEGSKNVHKGKYAPNIRKAVDWLMDQSEAKRDGLIFSGHPSETERYMYGHGLATQFLAWAYANEIDKVRREKLKNILTRAVKYTGKAQSTQGGWHLTSRVEGHDFDGILATAVQVQALYMAGDLGITVEAEPTKHGQEYLKAALAKSEKEAKPGPNRKRPTETAAALACLHSPHGYENHELSQKWIKYCQAETPLGRGIQFGRDELAHYYFAQAVFNDSVNGRSNGQTWTSYRTATFDHLQSSQNKDGSWPAGDGIAVGPVYATALWCTILQLDTRSHPLTRKREFITF